MVYCGKPSKGCSNCRERKIKCDQKEPGCGQCFRAKKECPGYRNQLDLMFRDESKSVTTKAKAKARKKQAGVEEPSARKEVAAPIEAGPNTHALSHESTTIPTGIFGNSILSQAHSHDLVTDDEEDCEYFLTQLQMIRDEQSFKGSFIRSLVPDERDFGGGSIRSLVPTSEDLALGFFNTNHIHKANVGKGAFGFVPEVYCNETGKTHLTSSIMAVGLAGFANTVKNHDLNRQARAHYVTALGLINQALQHPTAATKDSLLLSIMMMSIYETVTGSSQKSLQAWTEHINGAATLIKLRGHAQFQTKVGIRLFLQMFSNLMISCVQRGIAMPSHILVLLREVEKYVDTSDPGWRISEPILKFIAFRADARIGLFTSPEKKLEAALAVDAGFIEVCAKMPPYWRYETVYTQADPDEVWNGYYHVYSDYWVAQLYNAVRTCRILTNEYVRDTLLKGFLETPPQWMDREHTEMFQRSEDIVCEMRDEILASVPQHTGYANVYKYRDRFNTTFDAPGAAQYYAREMTDDGEGSGNMNLDGVQTGGAFGNFLMPTMDPNPLGEPIPSKDSSAMRSAGGYFLMWPLFLVGEMGLGTEAIRAWIISRLRRIGDNMGIMQAHALAQILANREEIRVWDVDDKHMRFEALELQMRKKQDAAQMQDGSHPDVAHLSKQQPTPPKKQGDDWAFWSPIDDTDQGIGLLSLSRPNALASVAEQGGCESSSFGLRPLDLQYQIEEALFTPESGMDNLQPEIGNFVDDGYVTQGIDMPHEFQMPIHSSDSRTVYPSPTDLTWQQEP